jgi:ATP-dependent RNA helicase DDX19/DBP5
MGFERPSKIQAATLPLIMDQKNIIAQAQSGSGKTVSFSCGMLSRVDPSLPATQALCLAPTRELADQIVRDALQPLSSTLPGVTIMKALAGVSVPPGSRCSAHVVVGTPGKVLEFMRHNYLNLSQVRIFVLDEADEMVANSASSRTLGAQTVEIKAAVPASAQILFYSATFTPEILAFSKKIVPKAYQITLKSTESLVLKEIKQVVMKTKDVVGGKLKVLQDIYTSFTIMQSIVFCDRITEVDAVAKLMNDTGFSVSVLHSDLGPEQRDKVMEDFRSGNSKVLVTTNALARGVDIPKVAVVVNYDLPVVRKGNKKEPDFATYVHRIGRTGRFGRQGTAINFVHSPEDEAVMAQIEAHYCGGAESGRKMLVEWDANDVAGLAADHNERSEGHGF